MVDNPTTPTPAPSDPKAKQIAAIKRIKGVESRRGAVARNAPFPRPAHRTGRADLPHPALGEGFHAFAHGRLLPSLGHAARFAASEHVPEGLGSSPISFGPSPLPAPLLQLRFLPARGQPPIPLASTVVTRFFGTTDLSAIPDDPAHALAGCQLGITCILIAGTSRVDVGFLACMPSPLPRRNRPIPVIGQPVASFAIRRRRPSPLRRWVGFNRAGTNGRASMAFHLCSGL